MHVLGEALNNAFLLLRKLTSAEQFLLELLDLRLAGELSSEEQPQDSLRDGLAAWDRGWGLLTNLKERGATISDSLHWVQLGGLVEHAWETTHATDDLGDGHFANDGVAVLLAERNDLLLSVGNHLLHALGESHGEVAAGRGLECGALGGRPLEDSVHHLAWLVGWVR